MWLSLFNRHLCAYLSGSAVYRVNTEIYHRLHVHVVACSCDTCQSSSTDTKLGHTPRQHRDLPQTAQHVHVVKGIYGRGMCYVVVCGCGMCQSSSTDTFLAACQARPSTVSTRRSSPDCMCTWLNVAVARCQSSSTDTRLGRAKCQNGDLPHTARARGCIWLWHASELFTRYQAAARQHGGLASTCTWLREYVAAACVRALQQTPLWHVSGSIVHRVDTEIFHRLH